jgi:hypothetical protein
MRGILGGDKHLPTNTAEFGQYLRMVQGLQRYSHITLTSKRGCRILASVALQGITPSIQPPFVSSGGRIKIHLPMPLLQR